MSDSNSGTVCRHCGEAEVVHYGPFKYCEPYRDKNWSAERRFEPASPDAAKVEEIAQEIANIESQKHLYAASNWRKEYPKLIAAILRPYFLSEPTL